MIVLMVLPCMSRPSRTRPQVYGHPLTSDWIINFGRKHGVDPKGDKSQFGLVVESIELIRDELKKEGEYALVRWWRDSPNLCCQELFTPDSEGVAARGAHVFQSGAVEEIHGDQR
ncbi:hypothetical protein L210DRAFT_140539 [Boletus edulis BED1]|uniref:Uncharacterized protein n=1 Tax=Boletus edulis BED1 TaxID=1328754 RepID=A0AAD4C8F8_BOLED|nr:hypothetical protein L210DRAFT_140539 [Boletus edulis BED1]